MKKYSNYLTEIIKEYPHITGGRKNYKAQSERIENVYKLIKKFKKNLKKKDLLQLQMLFSHLMIV